MLDASYSCNDDVEQLVLRCFDVLCHMKMHVEQTPEQGH